MIPSFPVTDRFQVPRFLPVNLPPQPRPPTSNDDAGGEGGDASATTTDDKQQQQPLYNHKKKKGRNKKRPRDSRQEAGEQLCRVMLTVGPEACTYYPNCKYSHDIQGFLKRKDKVGR